MSAATTVASKTLGAGLLERIGHTPLLRLERITDHLPGIQILGKAEWANPGGSVKDRAASAIVLDAERQGRLRFGQRGAGGKGLLDATSGNTGIAYSMLGAALGFPVTLCMPSNVSPERKKYLAAYGAHIEWTNPGEGSDGAIRRARAMAAEDPDRYFYADQYGERERTGRRITSARRTRSGEQTEGQVTHFVAGLGTSGTFMGTTRRLRELNPAIKCISMQPDSPFNGLEGLKHMETAIVPKIYDAHLADREHRDGDGDGVPDGEAAGAGGSGLLVGVSAAAAVAATALQVAEQEAAAGREAVIVTILCDSAEKYMSERFWTEGRVGAATHTMTSTRRCGRMARRRIRMSAAGSCWAGADEERQRGEADGCGRAIRGPTRRITGTTLRRRS